MKKTKRPTLKKPVLSPEAVLGFAEGRTAARGSSPARRAAKAKAAPRASNAATGSPNSRFPPSGYVRLTVNVRDELHMRLKIEAAKRRTTVGKMLEELVEAHL